MSKVRNKTHLLPTRGDKTACNRFLCSEVVTTPEITAVTCQSCEKAHDAYCEKMVRQDCAN